MLFMSYAKRQCVCMWLLLQSV